MGPGVQRLRRVGAAVALVVLAGCPGPAGSEYPDGAAPPDAASGGLAARWEPPVNISASAPMSDLRMNWGNAIALGEGGAVHAVWREVHGEEGGLDLAEVVHRRFDGAAWGPVEVIAPVRVGTGHPSVAAAGSHVYVVFHVHDPTSGEDEIFIALSDDGGAPGTYSAPRAIVSDATVTARSPLGEYATTPSVAALDSWVHVVWADDRHVDECGDNVSEIYIQSSGDAGQTWAETMRVSSEDCRSSWTPAVAAAGEHVHVAWTDERHNGSDCALEGGVCQEEEYYCRLAEHGAVVDGDEIRLTEDPPGAPAQSWAPAIAAWAQTVQIVFMDRAGSADFEVRHVRSLDRGQSWERPGRQLSASASGCRSARGTVAGAADVVHVTWMQLCGDSFATVEHVWSADLGLSWSPPSDVTSAEAVFAIQPYVAYRRGETHVVWTDQGEIFWARAVAGSVP